MSAIRESALLGVVTCRVLAVGLTLLVSTASICHGQDCALWVDRSNAWQQPWHEPVMAFDNRRGVAVMYSIGDNRLESVTYEWDGDKWFQRAAGFPNWRLGSRLAFDDEAGLVVMHGGFRDEPLPETWTWDGESWTHVSNRGPVRTYHAMAYDSRRHVVVLYGGSDGVSSHEDTWEWNGASWTQVAETGPGIRTSHAMVYDSWRDRTVLFGGNDQSGLRFGDTWEWDGSTWELRAMSGPPARFGHAMAFDSTRGATVLFGGDIGSVSEVDDCWIWDGVEWTELVLSGPPGRREHAMTFDSVRNRTVLFGGMTVSGRSSETWELASFITVTVDQHPVDQTIESGDPVEFTVIVSGSEPIEYQWRKDGTPLSNDGRITGVNTDTLRIDRVVSADAGEYDVVVSNPCGEVESEAATLLVTCAADFNNDGVVDTLDVLLYLNAFANGDPSADFNGDGEVNTLDFLAFLNAFVEGCQ